VTHPTWALPRLNDPTPEIQASEAELTESEQFEISISSLLQRLKYEKLTLEQAGDMPTDFIAYCLRNNYDDLDVCEVLRCQIRDLKKLIFSGSSGKLVLAQGFSE